MLTDDDLRELIEAAAAAAPEPAPLPEDLFQFSAPRSKRRTYRVLAPVAAVAAAFVVILVGGALLSGRDSSNQKSATAVAGSTGGSAAGSAHTGLGEPTVANSIGQAPSTTFPTDQQLTPLPANGAVTSAGAAGAATGGSGSAIPSAPPIAPAVQAPVDSARIIKNGTLEIRVNQGAVTESVNRLTGLATGFGGYVSDTRTTANADTGSQASATISVRVPAAAFEQLMSEASKLGEVRSTTTSGQDVTAQFTDIEAQLGALTQTRDQFLLVLGQAKNVGDILAVQDRITQVQIQIDQLQGQQRLLTDQTSFGTLSVTMLEPGATPAVPVVKDNKDLGDAWRDARDNFNDGIESIVSASGTLALVALCGAVLFGAGWLIYRRLRRQII